MIARGSIIEGVAIFELMKDQNFMNDSFHNDL